MTADELNIDIFGVALVLNLCHKHSVCLKKENSGSA